MASSRRLKEEDWILYSAPHHLHPQRFLTKVLRLGEYIVVRCIDKRNGKIFGQRVSICLVSSLIQTYYYNLEALWELLGRSMVFSDNDVSFSTQHIIHFPMTRSSEGNEALIIYKNVKRPINSIEGDIWRVSFLSEMNYPFMLEISVLRRAAETVPYACRIHPAYLVNYFDQHCMDRYKYYAEDHKGQVSDYHVEPHYMFDVLLDELFYDQESDAFLVRSIEVMKLENFLDESLDKNKKAERMLQRGIKYDDDFSHDVNSKERHEKGPFMGRSIFMQKPLQLLGSSSADYYEDGNVLMAAEAAAASLAAAHYPSPPAAVAPILFDQSGAMTPLEGQLEETSVVRDLSVAVKSALCQVRPPPLDVDDNESKERATQLADELLAQPLSAHAASVNRDRRELSSRGLEIQFVRRIRSAASEDVDFDDGSELILSDDNEQALQRQKKQRPLRFRENTIVMPAKPIDMKEQLLHDAATSFDEMEQNHQHHLEVATEMPPDDAAEVHLQSQLDLTKDVGSVGKGEGRISNEHEGSIRQQIESPTSDIPAAAENDKVIIRPETAASRFKQKWAKALSSINDNDASDGELEGKERGGPDEIDPEILERQAAAARRKEIIDAQIQQQLQENRAVLFELTMTLEAQKHTNKAVIENPNDDGKEKKIKEQMIDDIVRTNQENIQSAMKAVVLQLKNPVNNMFDGAEYAAVSDDTQFLLVREALQVKAAHRSELSKSAIVDMMQKGSRMSPFLQQCVAADLKAMTDTAFLREVDVFTERSESEKTASERMIAEFALPITTVFVVISGEVDVIIYEEIFDDPQEDTIEGDVSTDCKSYDGTSAVSHNASVSVDATSKPDHTDIPVVRTHHDSMQQRKTERYNETRKVYRPGDILGEEVLHGHFYWRKKAVVAPEKAASFCCFPVEAVMRYIGWKNYSVESAIVLFWKYTRLWNEITRYNQEVIANSVYRHESARKAIHANFKPMDVIHTARVRVYQTGEPIFEQNQPRAHLFIVLRGCCEYKRCFAPNIVSAGIMPEAVELGALLMCGDFSFMDGEDPLWLERMADLDKQITGNKSESEAVSNHRKSKYCRFDRHKNTLVATTRTEIATVPLAEIAKSMRLLYNMLRLSAERYPVAFTRDEDVVRKYYTDLNWTANRPDVVRTVAEESVGRTLNEVWNEQVNNNLSNEKHAAIKDRKKRTILSRYLKKSVAERVRLHMEENIRSTLASRPTTAASGLVAREGGYNQQSPRSGPAHTTPREAVTKENQGPEPEEAIDRRPRQLLLTKYALAMKTAVETGKLSPNQKKPTAQSVRRAAFRTRELKQVKQREQRIKHQRKIRDMRAEAQLMHHSSGGEEEHNTFDSYDEKYDSLDRSISGNGDSAKSGHIQTPLPPPVSTMPSKAPLLAKHRVNVRRTATVERDGYDDTLSSRKFGAFQTTSESVASPSADNTAASPLYQKQKLVPTCRIDSFEENAVPGSPRASSPRSRQGNRRMAATGGIKRIHSAQAKSTEATDTTTEPPHLKSNEHNIHCVWTRDSDPEYFVQLFLQHTMDDPRQRFINEFIRKTHL